MRLVPIPIDEKILEEYAPHWLPFLPKIAQRTKEPLPELIRKVMSKEMRLVLVWDDDTRKATALVGLALHYRGEDLIAEWRWMAGSGRKQWQGLLGELEQLLRDAGVVECRPLCRKGWQKFLEANGYNLTHVEMTKAL